RSLWSRPSWGIGSRSPLHLPVFPSCRRLDLLCNSHPAAPWPIAWTCACSAASRSSPSTTAITTAVPGASLSPSPCSMPLSTLCRANLPTRAPAAAPTATEAIGGVLDQDHALRPDRLVLDQPHQR